MKLSIIQSNILDCLKLLMAFLVVGIHVGKVAEYHYPNFVEFLTRIAVPFFFGVSGFLSYNSAISGNLTKSVYKYLRIYFVWVIVYMPFAAVYYMKNDITSYDAFTHYLRGVFISGEPPMAWHLWYVHAMIITILAISVSLKLRIKYSKRILLTLWLFSILFFVLRWFTDSSDMWHDEILQNLYMSNYQNAFFTGLPIFLTGMLVAAISDNIKYNLFTFIASALLLTASYLLFLLEFPVFVVISSFAMLLMILTVNIEISFDTIMIRELSKYVFFLHLIFVFLLRGHILNVYLFWISVTAFTLLSSILLIWAKRKFNISAI